VADFELILRFRHPKASLPATRADACAIVTRVMSGDVYLARIELIDDFLGVFCFASLRPLPYLT
jgi:hypothetical protein